MRRKVLHSRIESTAHDRPARAHRRHRKHRRRVLRGRRLGSAKAPQRRRKLSGAVLTTLPRRPRARQNLSGTALQLSLIFVQLLKRVVARDGIEPPTPAFSGPRSTTELSGLGINPPTGCAKSARPARAFRNLLPGEGTLTLSANAPGRRERRPSVYQRQPLSPNAPPECPSTVYPWTNFITQSHPDRQAA